MEKIKALLVKSGCKPELAEEVCKLLDSYKTTIREQFERDYAAKVEEAKKVCIEETEAHKRELSRRLQVFCETKSAAIESTLAKQSANNESSAVARLNTIHEMLAGIVPNGKQNNDVTAKLQKAQQQVKVANEARQQAEAKANRQTAIAEKALKAQRQLTTKIQQLESTRSQRPVVENKGNQRRIDTGRAKPAVAKTTRPTLLENQDRRPTQPKRQSESNEFSVNNIAESMETDLI